MNNSLSSLLFSLGIYENQVQMMLPVNWEDVAANFSNSRVCSVNLLHGCCQLCIMSADIHTIISQVLPIS